MDLDRPLDLAGLAEQVAQDLQHLDRVRVLARDLGELADGQLELARGEVVQALGVVGRGAEAASPARRPGARAAPRPAPPGAPRPPASDDGEQGGVGHRASRAHAVTPTRGGAARSQSPRARRIASTNSRRQPRPPRASITMNACVRTSRGASAGAAERPTSARMGRSFDVVADVGDLPRGEPLLGQDLPESRALVRTPWRTTAIPSSAARRVTDSEVRPERRPVRRPARWARTTPRPSRTWKALASRAVGEQEHGPVGHHAVHVGQDQLEGPAALRPAPGPGSRARAHIISVFQRSCRCRTPSIRPSPSVTRRDGDLAPLHDVEGARGQLAPADEHRVPRHALGRGAGRAACSRGAPSGAAGRRPR